MPDLGIPGQVTAVRGGTGLTFRPKRNDVQIEESGRRSSHRIAVSATSGGATELHPSGNPPEKQGQLHRIGRRQATIAAASDVHEKGALTAFSRPTPCCRQNNAISCTGLSLAIPLAEGRNSSRVGALSPEISPCSACSKFRRRIQSLCAVTIAGGSSLSATRSSSAGSSASAPQASQPVRSGPRRFSSILVAVGQSWSIQSRNTSGFSE